MSISDPFYAALLGGAIFCVVLAVAGGVLTRLTPWYHSLKKPGWKPPDWAFGPIWTTVFACLSLAIALAWEAAGPAQRQDMLLVLGVNGLLNIAWSAIFFVMKNPSLAFYELVVFWLSILLVLALFFSISRSAGLLVLPYIFWVTAAGVLNRQIVRLNPS